MHIATGAVVIVTVVGAVVVGGVVGGVVSLTGEAVDVTIASTSSSSLPSRTLNVKDWVIPESIWPDSTSLGGSEMTIAKSVLPPSV